MGDAGIVTCRYLCTLHAVDFDSLTGTSKCCLFQAVDEI